MTNMGRFDRIVRMIAGLVLLFGVFALGWGGAGAWFWVLALVGVVLVATAAIGFCPAYLPFGFRTCARQ